MSRRAIVEGHAPSSPSAKDQESNRKRSHLHDTDEDRSAQPISTWPLSLQALLLEGLTRVILPRSPQDVPFQHIPKVVYTAPELERGAV